MGIFGGIFLILCGVLAAANFFIEKKPDAKELIDKLAPYQGWMGFGAAIWGLVLLILTLINFTLLKHAFIVWLTVVLIAAVTFAVGVILGYDKLNEFIFSKVPKLEEIAKNVHAKLVPFQQPIGFASIGLGIWGILAAIIW